MAMLCDSNSSSRVDYHDSVEKNDKDNARPTKKSKFNNDLVGGEEEEGFSDVPKVTRPSNREIFNMWKEAWGKTYFCEFEEEYRFGIFEKAIQPPTAQEELYPNLIYYADQTPEELLQLRTCPNTPFYSYIYQADIEVLPQLIVRFKNIEARRAKAKPCQEEQGLVFPEPYF